MNNTSQYFRQLQRCERKLVGDMCVEESNLTPVFYPNEPVGGVDIVLRPVQVDEWIEYAKEKPVAGDFPISTFGRRHGKVGFAAEADEKVHNGAPRTHGCWVSSIEDEQITHWRRVTPPPVAVEQLIMIESHKVQFLDDGSLVVGCTTVTSEQFEEIAKRREQKLLNEGDKGCLQDIADQMTEIRKIIDRLDIEFLKDGEISI